MPMPKKSDTKPIPSDCEAAAIGFVAERKYTIAMRFRKIALKILVFLFVFCLGFILGGLRNIACHQMDDFHLFVSVYDTEQKLEDYYKNMERVNLDEFELSSESPGGRMMISWVRENRPLVAVGPFIVFVGNDTGNFSVRETQSLIPLIMMEDDGQSKQLVLLSSLEKSYRLPRFRATLAYSEDGIYERGRFAVHRENGTLERLYSDSKGIGVFDVMHVFENGVQFTYLLNYLTWELASEQPYPEDLKILDDLVVKTPLLRDKNQVERSASNDNDDVDVEQK